MVYLLQDTTVGKFPRVSNDSITALYLQNQLTKQDSSMLVTDTTPNNIGYYTLNVDFSNYVDGQYDYAIVDSCCNVKARGILQLGTYDGTTTMYEIEKNIITYNG